MVIPQWFEEMRESKKAEKDILLNVYFQVNII